MDKYVNQLTEVTSAGDNDVIPIQPVGVTGLRKIKKSNLVSGGSGTSIGLGKRNFEAGTTSPPSNQAIRYNNATVSSVTEIYIDDEDLDDQDRSNAILETTSGSLLRIITDESNFNVFKVTSVIDNTGSFMIVVTHLETKGTVSGEVSVEVDLVQDISGKSDRPVDGTYSTELLFDEDWKTVEQTINTPTTFTKATVGNKPQSFIEAYLTGDGTNSITFDPTWYNTNSGIYDNTKVNAVLFYYDKNGRIRYTIENLETAVGLTQLATPTNVQAVSGGADNIDISWDAVANASSYNVEVSDNGTSGWLLLGNTTNLTIEHGSLSEGTTKYYRVQAIGDGITYSNSNYSSVVNATTSSGSTLPTPTLTMTNVDSITNRATWSNVSGETGYQLQRSDNGTTGWATIYTAAANELTEDDATCTPEVQYFYRVKALGNGTTILDSAYSTVQAIITDGVQTPTLSLTFGDTQITANIGDIDANADSIELFRDTQSNFATEVAVEEYVSPATSVVDGSLTNGTRYYYRVRVEVNGVYSSYVSANTIANGWVTFNGTTNYLDFGDILDSLFSVADTYFELEIEVQNVTAGARRLISKINGNAGFHLFLNSSHQMVFAYGTNDSNRRTVSSDTAVSTGDKLTLKYDGSIDTGDGLDRVTLEINNVATGKTLSTTLGTLPANLPDVTYRLGFGDIVDASGVNGGAAMFAGNARNLKVRSAGGTIEIDVPDLGNGIDISGNNRNATVN